MTIVSRSKLLLFVTLVLVAGASLASTPMWDARKLVYEHGRSGSTSLVSQGKPVATVDRSKVAQFVEIVDKIGPQYGLRPDIVIFPGSAPNAFATRNKAGLPVIGVNPAMLDVAQGDADMVATVVGHELAHLQLNHIDEARSREAAVNIIAIIAGAAIGYNVARRGVDGTPFLELAGVGALLVNRKFDRDQERAADELGLKAMFAAGYDGKAAPRLWERMKSYGGGGSGLWTSTHPSHDERIEALTQMAVLMRPERSGSTAVITASTGQSIEAGPTRPDNGGRYSLTGSSDWCLVSPQSADCTFPDQDTCSAKGNKCRARLSLAEDFLDTQGDPVQGSSSWCIADPDGTKQRCEFDSWDQCNAKRLSARFPCTNRDDLRPVNGQPSRPTAAVAPSGVSSSTPTTLQAIACQLPDGAVETLPRVQCASRGGAPR